MNYYNSSRIPQEYFSYIVRKYGGLEYTIKSMHQFFNRFSLSGKRVLEIGGSNHPRELTIRALEAKQWVCVDTIWHEDDLKRWMPKHYGVEPIIPLSEAPASVSNIDEYAIFKGMSEEIPYQWENQFDVVVSLAAFEHIPDISTTLGNIYRCLNKEHGECHVVWGPIWSGHCGHHIHPVRLADGQMFYWRRPFLPDDWSHLLMEEIDFAAMLMRKGAPEEASILAAKSIYTSSDINRIFFDEYASMMNSGPFKQIYYDKEWFIPPPAHIQAALEERHPGKKEFSTSAAYVRLCIR